VPLVVAGAAAGLLVIGAGVWGSVDGEYDALKSRCAPRCAPSSWSELQSREQAGAALVGIAIAAAAADAVLWGLRAKKPSLRAEALGVRF
jgi:hypothetical protein